MSRYDLFEGVIPAFLQTDQIKS